MKHSLVFPYVLLLAWGCTSAPIADKNMADAKMSVQKNSDKVNDATKTAMDKTIYLEGADPRVFENFVEGWSTPEKAQVLVSQALNDTAQGDPVTNARSRLAFILLQDNYNLGRDYKTISAKVVKSRSFQGLGKEQVHKRQAADKVAIVLIREGKDLKKAWLSSLMQLEKEVPELAKMRR